MIMPTSKKGSVLLVGAGPGAADLLTMRALRALESCDVVLYDALVSDEILALIPPTTRKIAVGKRGHKASTPQDFTNALMAKLALAGATVVRLKGGDPSVFGRSAEERAYLEALGVPVEVVPGITTASAAAAQFGFSLTSRGIGRRIMFATGHNMEGPEKSWSGPVCADDTTLCLYMAHQDIASIATELLRGGRAASTPALILSSVSRPEADMLVTTLGALVALAMTPKSTAPKFIIIGEVCRVARAKELFKSAPLEAICVPHPARQAC
jgi:uroporphyrin-III C-methyltransferase